MSLIFACLLAAAIDGDTLRCDEARVPDGHGAARLREDLEAVGGRVRLARIDAPERGEAGFEEARDVLAALIAGREVTCTLVDADPAQRGFQRRDRFGRPVARCSTLGEGGGADLGAAMIGRGLAVVWPRAR